MTRHTASTITDEALDALYAEITRLQDELGHADGTRIRAVNEVVRLRAVLHRIDQMATEQAEPDN